MFDLPKKKKINFISTIVLVAVFLLSILWQFLSTGVSGGGADSLNLSIYSSAASKIATLQEAYNNGVFNDSLFIRLKSIFRLPLETGLVGKDNPFYLPLPPEIETLVR